MDERKLLGNRSPAFMGGLGLFLLDGAGRLSPEDEL